MTALPADCTCTPGALCEGAACDECWRLPGCALRDVPPLIPTEQERVIDRLIGQARLDGWDVTVATQWVVHTADGAEVFVAADEPTARSEKAYTPGGTITTRRVVTFVIEGEG